jgi:hypothetical protein
MARPPTLQLHWLSPDDAPGDALVIILFEQGQKAGAEHLAQLWGPGIPRSVFAGLEIDLAPRRTDLVALRTLVDETVESRGLQTDQVVMLGAGRAGRLAIDLALLGVVPGAAVITLDIPLEAAPTALAPVPASVRMVQHSTPDDPDGERFHAVVEALQQRRVNVRSMLLPDLEAASLRATQRAAGAFLVELVANASRLAPTGKTWP